MIVIKMVKEDSLIKLLKKIYYLIREENYDFYFSIIPLFYYCC